MTNITLRSVKGSPLTNAEVDSNFSSLNDYKVEQTDSTGSALIPSGTTAQRDGSPSAGMFRYNSDLGQFEGYTTVWGEIGGSVDSAIIQGIVDSDWTTRGINDLSDGYNQGNSVGLGSGALANDDGTTNSNTAVGTNALNAVTTGNLNTAVGSQAGSNTTGIRNTFLGVSAGRSNTSGDNNVAIGEQALQGSTSTGNDNVAVGKSTLQNNTSGFQNVVVGSSAGTLTTTGKNQIIIGYNAEPSSATVDNEITLGNGLINSFRIPGLQNTATHGQVLAFDSDGGDIAFTTQSINDLSDGYFSGLGYSVGLGDGALANDDGTINRNTAVGWNALNTVTSGAQNTALGAEALRNNTGSFNTAVGRQTANVGTGGTFNTYLGSNAGTYSNGSYNIGIGYSALQFDSTTTGAAENIGIGYQTGLSLTTGDTNVLIGHQVGKNITTGLANVAIGGELSLETSTFGSSNTVVGTRSGRYLNGSGFNVALGYGALQGDAAGASASYNVGVGYLAGGNITTGIWNTFLGYDVATTVTTGSNNIVIGNAAEPSSATVSDEITLGDANISGFRIPGLQSTATHGQVLAFDSAGGDIAFTTVAAGGLDSADLTNGTFTGKVIFDSAQVNGIEFKSPSTTHTMTLDLDNNDILRLTNGTNDLITIQDSGAGSTIFSVQDGGTEYFKVDASGFTAFVNHAIGSQTLTTTSTSQTAVATFAHASYIGAEAVITAKDGIHSHITKLNIIHDGTTAYATEYGSLFDSASLSTYDVDISGADLRILATPASTNSTVFKVALTLMDV